MRKRLIATAPALAAALLAAAPALAAPSERLVSGWNPMSVTFSGENLAYARSEAAFIREGGYTVHRTDTFRVRLSGARLTGAGIEGMVLRTSAGRTTAGAMAGDGTGRYIITATGSGFPPQLVFCCTKDPALGALPLPVEASGRPDGPVTVAATLDGPLVRFVLVDPAGTLQLVSFHVAGSRTGPVTQRDARPFDAEVDGRLVAMAPGIVAWADRSTPPSVHLATTPEDEFSAFPGPVIPQTGRVVRLHVTRTTVAALVRTAAGFELDRFDAPNWERTVVWTGARAPGLTALGDRTVALVDGGVLQQQVIGASRRNIYRLRGRVAALATDGRRIAVVERRTVRVKRRPTRKTAIVVVPVRNPPGGYTLGRAG